MKRIKISILSVLLFVSLATACSNKPTTDESKENVKLNVGTWNIAGNMKPDTQEMSRIFAENNLDIVGIQEADVFNGRNDYDMVGNFITDVYPYVHFAKGRDFSDGYFGTGVISKYELQETSSIPIESTGSRATKVLERVVFEKEGKKIAFYNVHLSWENNDLRRRQISQVIERINEDPIEYKIITGDFNTDQHDYEYSMFLDNFNIANGKDGVWFDTFGGVDPSMNVFTIDNVICSKNIKISNVQKLESNMSDHFLLYTELELLGKEEGEANTDNRALGQGVTVSSTNNELSPYLLVDYDKLTPWVSDSNDSQEIIIELDRIYNLKNINILWGNEKASTIEVLGSVDGKEYTSIETISNKSDLDSIKLSGTPYKFLKFNLSGKANADQGYEINEIQVFGDIIKSTIDNTNVLENGDFSLVENTNDSLWYENNKPTNWELSVAIDDVDKSKVSFIGGFDSNDNVDSNQSLTITQKGIGESGKASLKTTVQLKPNTEYQLVFNHKSKDLVSGNFGLEMNQFNSNNESISTHYARLNDNLCMSNDWARFNYNFVTSYSTETMTLSINVGGNEGTLWLDGIEIREVTPTENVFLSTKKSTLKVNEKGTIKANILPKDYTDVKLNWVSLDDSIVSIDENGNIKALKEGQTYVGLKGDSDLVLESYILITVTK